MIAIDDTEGSMKAVSYVGQHFGQLPDLKITLFHVLPGLPSRFWDDGHILSSEEKTNREKVISRWRENQKPMLEGIFAQAKKALAEKGIKPEFVNTKSASAEQVTVAEAIIDEARSGGYDLLVVGRVCRHSPARHALLGDNTTALIHRGAGVALCVVE